MKSEGRELGLEGREEGRNSRSNVFIHTRTPLHTPLTTLQEKRLIRSFLESALNSLEERCPLINRRYPFSYYSKRHFHSLPDEI